LWAYEQGPGVHADAHRAPAFSASGVERQSFETRPAVEDAIQQAIGNCLVETDLGIGKKTQVLSPERRTALIIAFRDTVQRGPEMTTQHAHHSTRSPLTTTT